MKPLFVSAFLVLALSLNAQVFIYKNSIKSVETTNGKVTTNRYGGFLIMDAGGNLAAVKSKSSDRTFSTAYLDDVQISYVKAGRTKEYILLLEASKSPSDQVLGKYEMETRKAKGLLYSVNVGVPESWRIPKLFTMNSFSVYPGTNSLATELEEQTATLTLDLTRTVTANKAADDLNAAIARCESYYTNLGYMRDN